MKNKIEQSGVGLGRDCEESGRGDCGVSPRVDQGVHRGRGDPLPPALDKSPQGNLGPVLLAMEMNAVKAT